MVDPGQGKAAGQLKERVKQAPPPPVDTVTHVLSAIALRQRPPVPGRHSTVGTLTQTYNLVHLLYTRVGEHRCPNGRRSTPTLAEVGTGTTDENGWQTCPVGQAYFQMPVAESFSFSSPLGACPTRKGLRTVDEIDERILVPDVLDLEPADRHPREGSGPPGESPLADRA